VLEFLLGLRDDRVLLALAARGFGDADRAKGWDLLRALGMTQSVPSRTSSTNEALASLDAWRRDWLRLVHVSLMHGFADLDAKLFRRIDKNTQPSIEVVPIFLDRIEKLERSSDANIQAAVAKLRARGFTSQCRDEARQMVRSCIEFHPPEFPDPELRRAAMRQAEAALWAYYVEWSQVARTVIKDVSLLGLLGFRDGQAAEDESDEAAGTSRESKTRKAKASTPKPKAHPAKVRERIHRSHEATSSSG
jgi:hypothetical protein